MHRFWHLFLHNTRWFMGTVIVILVITFFLWRVIDPIGSTLKINGFLKDVWEIVKFIIYIIIIIFVIKLFFKHSFPSKSKGHH